MKTRQRNENRPGYKKTRVGWIPEEWAIKKGAEISTLITKGSSPKWQGFSYQDNGVLFITSENVRDGFLDISNPKFLPPEFNKKQKTSILRKGDILINIVGASIGRTCKFNFCETLANINQAVCLLRPNKKVTYDFVVYYLQHPTTIKRLLSSQVDSARPNLTLADIRNFYFIVPPLPEQKKIAEILSAWDRAIEITNRLITNYELLKKGLMQQLLTGRVRFPEFGKSITNEELRITNKKGGGTLPEGWRVVRLKEIATVNMGTSPSSTSYNNDGRGWPLIQGNADIKNRHTSPSRWTTELTTECLIGDLVMTVRAPVGDVALSKHHACVGRGACVIKPKPGIKQHFLFQLLVLNEKKWNRFGQGSTFTCLTREDIRNCKFVIPNLQEQSRIAAVLSTCDREIELLKKKQEKLKEQKKGLMQKLLTGEIRHPEFRKVKSEK